MLYLAIKYLNIIIIEKFVVFFWQVERFVDRKVDNAEGLIKNRQQKAKTWYNSFTGKPDFVVKEIHIFVVSFVAGMAVGVVCG